MSEENVQTFRIMTIDRNNYEEFFCGAASYNEAVEKLKRAAFDLACEQKVVKIEEALYARKEDGQFHHHSWEVRDRYYLNAQSRGTDNHPLFAK